MRPSRRVLCAAVLIVLCSACGSRDPIGPTPLDQGIVVYMHAGFRGASQQVASDLGDLGGVQGPCGSSESESDRTWNDCISSVRVLPGWSATLYGDKNFRGATVEVTEDLVDLSARPGSCSGSYDDCISSIRVHRK